MSAAGIYNQIYMKVASVLIGFSQRDISSV